MPSLQQLRRDKPDWVVRKPISLQGALAGEYVTKYLSLSYRWRARGHPDESGVQLRALQEHLKQPAQSKIEYVFVDYLCLAQGKEKTPKDKAEFKMMLPNINFLYLGTSVLILMFDRTYMERFWPLLEAWLSCMKGSERGLVSADDDALRCTIRPALEQHAHHVGRLSVGDRKRERCPSVARFMVHGLWAHIEQRRNHWRWGAMQSRVVQRQHAAQVSFSGSFGSNRE